MRWVAVGLTGFLLGFLFAQANFPQPQGQLVKATVIRVIDGDTFEVRIGQGSPVRVRVIGYDSPEKDEPFGDTATKFVKALLEGREVLLESDVQAFDRYGRRLHHVWLQPTLLSELMLLTGLGRQMTIPPNVRHVEFLTKAQKQGSEIGLGIWSK